MRVCIWCKRAKPLEEFTFRSTSHEKRIGQCKECQRAYCREHYKKNKTAHNARRMVNRQRYVKRNRRLIVDVLRQTGCIDCAELDPAVLDFDHVKGIKRYNVSEMVCRGASWTAIAAEIEKCEVRCANCHRRKTAQQFQWFKVAIGA